jgi:hypothetical protein
VSTAFWKNFDAFWTCVGQISGVLTICGFVVVIITALALTLISRLFLHHQITTTEITWFSLAAGTLVAGALSVFYGFALNRQKSSPDENRQAYISTIFGVVLIVVAALGFMVPAAGGSGAYSPAKHSHVQGHRQPSVRSTGCPGSR